MTKILSKEEFLKDTTACGNNTGSGSRLDIELKRYLDFPNGFFVEVGANNGVSQSNTKIFEDLFGWNGLLIEANPHMYKQCVKNRPNSIVENYALVSPGYEGNTVKGDFDDEERNAALKGSIAGKIKGISIEKTPERFVEVPAITLTKLLEKHHVTKIDFFSLDVEGSEMDVLKGLDFHRYSPMYILTEVSTKDTPWRTKNKDEICEFLERHGYEMVECLSNYSEEKVKNWSGANDYLFRRISTERE